jgi:putative endonuclease
MAGRRQLNRAIGNLGEEAAAGRLLDLGYRVLERNWRCRAGEIDIIAEHHGVIAFVEVKARSPRALRAPADAVDADKRRRIRAASRAYLSRFREPSPARFDIVSVFLDATDRVERIEVEADAFQ